MSRSMVEAGSEPELSRGVRELVAADEDSRPANLLVVCLIATEVLVRSAVEDRADAAALAALGPLAASVIAAHLSMVTGHRTALGVAATLCNMLAIGLGTAAFDEFWMLVAVLLPAMYFGRLLSMAAAMAALVVGAGLFALPAVLWAPDGVDEVQRVVVAAILLVGAVSAGSVRAWNDDLARLEHQRSVLDTVVGNVEVGLLLLDEHGRERLSNPRQGELIRLAFPDGPSADAGTSASGWIFDEDATTPLPLDKRPAARALRGEDFRGQLLWIGRDPAARRAISVAVHTISDARGRRTGSLMVCHDLTDVLRAVRVKQDFVALVSHELRTPLTSILGYLDLALEEAEAMPEDVFGHLRVAERNAQRLLRLVSDLLSAASAEQGTLEMTMLPSPLHDVVIEALMELQGFAERHQVKVTQDVQRVPSIDIDVFRTGQVVANLVSNAVKYSSPGATVEVRLTARDGTAVLEVEDHGIGMSADEAELAFSTFYRARQVAEKAIQGVGLGLPITRTIVERMGGTITLASEPGRGTLATVTLPLSADADGPGAAGSHPSASGSVRDAR